MAAPQIQTYHCICTSLLLATTHTLSSLPRRSPPSLDSALILPILPLPSPSTSDSPEPEGEEGTESDLPAEGYSTLVGTTTDRNITTIRRSDGFEMRRLLRCGRCRLVVGYELDTRGAMDSGKEGERVKVVYLLPGGVMSTEAMMKGKKLLESDVEVEKGVVTWE